MDFGYGFTRVQESFYDDNPINGHDYDKDKFFWTVADVRRLPSAPPTI